MSVTSVATLVIGIGIGLIVLIALARTVRIVPQASAGIVERLGRYQRTLDPGLHFLVPFLDRLRPLVDMREQVVAFPPQPVITQDNVTISIDTVFYFTVTDAFRATYEVAAPPVRDRAADGHDAPQRDRLALARGGAHLAGQDQRRPPHRARRGDRALGPAREPDRAEVDRPAEPRSRRRWRSRCAPSASAAP